MTKSKLQGKIEKWFDKKVLVVWGISGHSVRFNDKSSSEDFVNKNHVLHRHLSNIVAIVNRMPRHFPQFVSEVEKLRKSFLKRCQANQVLIVDNNTQKRVNKIINRLRGYLRCWDKKNICAQYSDLEGVQALITELKDIIHKGTVQDRPAPNGLCGIGLKTISDVITTLLQNYQELGKLLDRNRTTTLWRTEIYPLIYGCYAYNYINSNVLRNQRDIKCFFGEYTFNVEDYFEKLTFNIPKAEPSNTPLDFKNNTIYLYNKEKEWRGVIFLHPNRVSFGIQMSPHQVNFINAQLHFADGKSPSSRREIIKAICNDNLVFKKYLTEMICEELHERALWKHLGFNNLGFASLHYSPSLEGLCLRTYEEEGGCNERDGNKFRAWVAAEVEAFEKRQKTSENQNIASHYFICREVVTNIEVVKYARRKGYGAVLFVHEGSMKNTMEATKEFIRTHAGLGLNTMTVDYCFDLYGSEDSEVDSDLQEEDLPPAPFTPYTPFFSSPIAEILRYTADESDLLGVPPLPPSTGEKTFFARRQSASSQATQPQLVSHAFLTTQDHLDGERLVQRNMAASTPSSCYGPVRRRGRRSPFANSAPSFQSTRCRSPRLASSAPLLTKAREESFKNSAR